MQTIDIEKLLQWALREELPKGRPVSASPWDIISNFGALGTRVDTGGYRDGLGFVFGEPDADAQAIAEAIRALPGETRLSAEECCALLGPYVALDPLAVKAAADASFNMTALVIRCAILGTRMEWDIGLPQPSPTLRRARQRWAVAFAVDGYGALYEVKANGRGNYPDGASTYLSWHEPTVGQLLEARAEYAVWHRALIILVEALDGALAAFRPELPAARAEPWREGQAAEPATWRGEAVHLDKLALTPMRPAALRPLESDIERKAREWPLRRRRGRRAAQEEMAGK
jgi:hypothetical protein